MDFAIVSKPVQSAMQSPEEEEEGDHAFRMGTCINKSPTVQSVSQSQRKKQKTGKATVIYLASESRNVNKVN